MLLGFSTAVFWMIVIYKRETQKYIIPPLERYFHIIAEFVMSFLSLCTGIVILLNHQWGSILFILTMGFMIYATINAIGIYAQMKYWMLVATLITIAVTSTILVIFNFVEMITY